MNCSMSSLAGWLSHYSVTVWEHDLLCVHMYKSYPNKNSCQSMYCLCLDTNFVLKKSLFSLPHSLTEWNRSEC